MNYVIFEEDPATGLCTAVLASDSEFVTPPAEMLEQAVARAFKGLDLDKGRTDIHLHVEGGARLHDVYIQISP